jgi:fermentation-respiration switch protein FrsA (DUF1100 family)
MTLVLAILLAFVFVLLFYPKIEDFFVFYPTSDFEVEPSNWQISYEDVRFDRGGHELHGWFFPAGSEAPVLLFCHGNAGNISHRLDNVRLLLEQGLSVFIFDYAGYGKSPGKPSEKRIYQDGVAAFDWLVEDRGIDGTRIVVFGRSLGAAVAIEICSRRRAKALIIESAFTSIKAMAGATILFKPFSFLIPAHYNNARKIGLLRIPKLIVHGDQDEIVPYSMGRALFEAAPAPKFFLPIAGAGHNDTYVVGGQAYFESLAAFTRDRRI